MLPPSIVVGDAKAGETYFKSKCAACHSVTGDLKGIGTRIPDPKLLQNTFLMPGGGGRGRGAPGEVPPTTVTVTLAAGKKVEGTLVRIDDFIVTLTEADGTQRSFRRDGDNPKVEIHDPLQAAQGSAARLHRQRYPQSDGVPGDSEMKRPLYSLWPLLLPAIAAGQMLDPALLSKPLGDSWPTYSGDYSGKRYSSLRRSINPT